MHHELHRWLGNMYLFSSGYEEGALSEHREVHRWLGNTSLFSSGYEEGALSEHHEVHRWLGNTSLFSSGYEEGAPAPSSRFGLRPSLDSPGMIALRANE